MTKAAATWEKLDTLNPWKGNPRRNAEAVEPVALSIWRFGFGAPVLVRATGREVIAGHTRLLAMRFLLEHVYEEEGERWRARRVEDGPFVARGAPGPGVVPARLLDLPEGEARALALADNRLGELAEWEPEGLQRELRALAESSVSLDGLGWSAEDLAGLLDEAPAPASSGPSGAAVPPLPGAARVLVGRCEERLRELPAESIESCVCDPPYGLSEPPDPTEVLRCWLGGKVYQHPRPGFMGHEWDAFVPGPEVWREVFRVLKPGAHVVAFAGSRTVDWMTLSLRLAGFEIRDTGAWAHWTGWPKSVDIGKAIDRSRDDEGRVYEVTEWLADACARGGLAPKDLDLLFGTTSMGAHWLKRRPNFQPESPGVERFAAICAHLGIEPDPEIADLVAQIEEESGEPGADFLARPVVAREEMVDTTQRRLMGVAGTNPTRLVARTEAATEKSRPWQGWGTALKPTVEPWVLARKPMGREGGKPVSVAANVLRFGTGAVNVDGCRFPEGDPMWPGPNEGGGWTTTGHVGDWVQGARTGTAGPVVRSGSPLGRWPANLVACSKASRAEREAGLDSLPVGSSGLRNEHPTLKPIRLMAWLARLVTPVGGTVLDPFAGSGTVGCASLPQGFSYVGIEIDPTHCSVAEARIAHWASVGLSDLSTSTEPEEEAP